MLRLSGVTKRFGGRTVLRDVSLEVARGEQVAVLGESGIGKSTLLNVIAGLEPVDAGSIAFDGFEVAALSDDAATRLRREHFGFVFQAFHLLPHLTAEQNVGLPLLLRGRPAAEIRSRARALLGAVGLG
ncbi:MAG TPA: ATP-binding cassette domain-containing protein, partial [Burkholderiales bacterium]|nr:ATP-binding cassette domain-containing protein [Burkholderiales bacterium]